VKVTNTPFLLVSNKETPKSSGFENVFLEKVSLDIEEVSAPFVSGSKI